MKQAPPAIRPHPYLLWPLACVGIIAISFASILIRLADAPSLTIAAYRVGLASLILAPYCSLKLSVTHWKWNGRLLGATVFSGLCLSFHFTFWISSLKMTSVASSTTLVSITPLFVALFSFFRLGERLPKRSWVGTALVLIGSGLVAGNDLSFSQEALFGDLLALAGALAASGYLLAGQFVRRHLDLGTYTFGAYGSAALFLLSFCTLTGAPLSEFSNQTYLILILLAIIPQLIGHTTFNWTLKFLSPTTVAVLILGEPIGATILAYLFFGEAMTIEKGLGLLILGAGIFLCTQVSPPPTENAQ